VTTAQLELERKRLQEEIAAKAHDPHARLSEVERELDKRSTEERERVAQARAAYGRAVEAYVPAQEHALDTMRAFVSAVEAAQEARRVMEAAGRRDGARSAALPESIHVRTGRRDATELRDLRARAALLANADF